MLFTPWVLYNRWSLWHIYIILCAIISGNLYMLVSLPYPFHQRHRDLVDSPLTLWSLAILLLLSCLLLPLTFHDAAVRVVAEVRIVKGNRKQLLSPLLCHLQVWNMVGQALTAASGPLMADVQVGVLHPIRVEGAEDAHNVGPLRLSVALCGKPVVRYVGAKLWQRLGLRHHAHNTKLLPLADLHMTDLVVAQELLIAGEDLMQEADRAVLFLRQEDVGLVD